MKKFYFQKEDGSIEWMSANIPYDRFTTELTEETIIGYDGKCYILGTEPEEPFTSKFQKVQREFSAKLEQRIVDFAKEKDYDDQISIATYINSTIPQFNREANFFVPLRDQTYAIGYTLITQYAQQGVIPTWEEIEAQLPVLDWNNIPTGE